MQHEANSFKSPLGKVRGLGSAKGGTHHWWMQRCSAIALVPLVIWFVITVVSILGADEEGLFMLVKSPFNIISFMLLVLAGIYHGTLGMHVIIEDYVHCKAKKITSMLIINFVSIVTAITGVAAILTFHLSVFS